MKYTVITDSCCNLFSKDLTNDKIDFHVVPLTLIIGDEEFVDDEKLDTAGFIGKMNASKTCAKSACPSPDAFFETMKNGDNVIIVTLSSKLSGTYASAMEAGEMFKKQYPNKKLFVMDSLSADTGQDLILTKLCELINSEKYTFDELTAKLVEIRKSTRVRFLLQDIGNLVKNGRMSALIGKILSTAKIKLICGDDGAGEIKKYSMSLGTRHGLNAMAELPGKEISNDMPIMIAHVFNEEDASYLKRLLESKFGFKNIKLRLMRGVSSLYAADKGIVMAY